MVRVLVFVCAVGVDGHGLQVGWRGEPGVKDEPQHTFMGACQAEIMDAMKVLHALPPTLLPR